MERRIFGLENEYGVTCTLRGQRRLSPDEVARYLFRRVVSWGRSSNVFLENGARLYLDVGSHPEYATPECDSISDLVVHDKAGERILEHLVVSAEARPAGRRHPGGHLPFQEQHRLGRELLRVPRELPHDEAGRFHPLRGSADPLPDFPPDLRGGWQSPANGARCAVLHKPAGGAHLGKRFICHHPQPADNKHAATSLTPTPSVTAGCTLSSATRT